EGDGGGWSTGSRDDPRSTGSRDEPRPTGSRAAVGWRSDGPRPATPRDDPGAGVDLRDDLTAPNGPKGVPKLDLPPAAILTSPEDPSSPNGPPAAILGPSLRCPAGDTAFPLALGPLTVHSLGVGGVGPAATLPLGFKSTRLFPSTRRPARRCLYTCRVLAGPRCEIVAEDDPGKVLVGPTPDLCHARLLQALGEAGGHPRATPPPTPGAGDEFFGLSHPTVRRLLQGGEVVGGFAHPEEEEEE
ncbi:TBRG1 regulator, partial [Atlantisia rogersi]|nr:TBRG1 regulator [Atlantisia rogersi]